MATYLLEPTRETLHGTFSRAYPPVLTIDASDSAVFHTLNVGWNLEPPLFQQGKVTQVVDLRVTQIVNGARSVHAILPYGAIR